MYRAHTILELYSGVNMKLYWWWTTNPQKVRLALEEASIPYTLELVDLFRGKHRTDDYTSVSPTQRVPALELTDGSILWESGAALLWIGQHHPQLWPQNETDHIQAMNLLFMESAAFQEHAGTHFFNRVVLPAIGKQGDETRIAKAAKKIKPLLDVLHNTLGDNEYLFGEITVIDLAFAPWLPVLDLSEYPTLSAWRTRLMSRPAWANSDFRYGNEFRVDPLRSA